MSRKSEDKIRVGVVGVGRGMSFASGATDTVGMELVALCDSWEEKLDKVAVNGITGYTDYEAFLQHDMDAVILANYFHEHAPFAIKALNAGFHVMSETASCKTMGEGVALCEAVEKSGKIYMLAENYAYMLACQEMRQLYRKDTIGKVRYAEGEYNHPGEENWRLSISCGKNHWRNWLPSTYYCSHALAPMMYVTDTNPVSVNALSIIDETAKTPNIYKFSDAGGILLTRMDNGAVFRIFGLMLNSIHRVQYEFHGERGLMGTGGDGVRIHHEPWLKQETERTNETYTPDWPEHAELANKAGHGGGDFWTNFHFANAIRSGEQPYLNVYRGCAMAAVGILGWKSCLNEGAPIAIPDFSNKEARAAYRDDQWSPFPEDAGPGQPPPSIEGIVEPSPEAIKRARKVWDAAGYQGD